MTIINKATLVGAALSAAVSATAIGFAVPAHAAGTVHGCPYGYVCVYPQNKGWNGDVPSLRFYTYGGHNLSNQIGSHYVLNNQQNALAIFCSSYGGCATASTSQYQIGGLGWTWEESTAQGRSWANVNLTPVNSIDLEVAGP
jgi:hypothetical protein